MDGENRLLGIITVDDVIDIIEAENTEDFQRISAVVPFEEEYFKRSMPRLFWSRFCWLAILLFTSLISTTIMEWNAATLKDMVALAFFIPMVIGTCGNAATQSATMVVRALALGEVCPKDVLRVFGRENVDGGGPRGVALGLMAYFRVFLQDHNLMLAAIVGSALLATLLLANLGGALIPLLLKQARPRSRPHGRAADGDGHRRHRDHGLFPDRDRDPAQRCRLRRDPAGHPANCEETSPARAVKKGDLLSRAPVLEEEVRPQPI
ncbi:MAG: magnesium transporter [Desulfosudis oleivorans]|nr:magnesium transporter [Desulfosudis oleivorans]